MTTPLSFFSFFFFNDTATTEIYTLSLHDALPISYRLDPTDNSARFERAQSEDDLAAIASGAAVHRSEEHTSELQSQSNLVCRLLLEKKKNRNYTSSMPRRTGTYTLRGTCSA